MKIFDTDLSVKYIIFELEGKRYTVQFRDNLLKGVHDISIFAGRNTTNIKILDAYPPLKRIAKEIWQVYIPCWLKVIKRRLKCNRNCIKKFKA